jgi:hypothetical protein
MGLFIEFRAQNLSRGAGRWASELFDKTRRQLAADAPHLARIPEDLRVHVAQMKCSRASPKPRCCWMTPPAKRTSWQTLSANRVEANCAAADPKSLTVRHHPRGCSSRWA